MHGPDVVNQLVDKENDVIYEVLAYRKLTKEEVKRAVWQALAKKKKKVKPGETYTIMTVIS